MLDFGNYIWLIIAVALLIAEVTAGSFYLLVLALSATCAWFAQLLGLQFLAQTIVCLIVAAATVLPLYFYRKKLKHHDKLLDLDVGEIVTIKQWENRSSQTRYRGSVWQVILIEGAQISHNNLYSIVSIESNRLLVKPKE